MVSTASIAMVGRNLNFTLKYIRDILAPSKIVKLCTARSFTSLRSAESLDNTLLTCQDVAAQLFPQAYIYPNCKTKRSS